MRRRTMKHGYLYEKDQLYIKTNPTKNKWINQFEKAASFIYRCLVTQKHAVVIDELFYSDQETLQDNSIYNPIGSSSLSIKGFMHYSELKKYFLKRNRSKEDAALHIFESIEQAGFGMVYAALRFAQDDDLTVKNLTVSTHKDGNKLIIDSVIITDVDRSLGGAMYGSENKKYGFDRRNIPGWSATAHDFAITAKELNNPMEIAPNKGMFYGPAQNAPASPYRLSWGCEEKTAFRKIAENHKGKFYQDFCRVLFKAAFILEPLIESSLHITVRDVELLNDIKNSLAISCQCIRTAITQSKNFQLAFLQNYSNWLAETKQEIAATEEFQESWSLAIKQNKSLPVDSIEFAAVQFNNMLEKIKSLF